MEAQPLPTRFNIADHLILPNLRAGQAERPYWICGEETLSFEALHRRANQVGQMLLGLGVQPGQRVLLLLDEGLDFPPCFWGAVRMGAIPVPLNPALTTADYAYHLADSQAAAWIVSARLWERAAPALRTRPETAVVIADGPEVDGSEADGAAAGGASGDLPGLPTLAQLTATMPQTLDTHFSAPDDPAFWLYTSGTTGRPKGVIHRQRSMAWVAERYMQPVLGLKPGDLSFSAPKSYFAYGLGNSLYGPLAMGSTALVQTAPAAAENCLRLLFRHRPSVFYATPTLLHAMAAHDSPQPEISEQGGRQPERPLDFLRMVLSAGEALPRGVYERWRERFGVRVLDGIGCTEMLHFYIANTPQRHLAGSTGALLPGCTAQLRDEQGQPAAPGEPGELWVRSGAMTAGYHSLPPGVRNSLRGDLLATGDRFRLDEAGFYHFLGRVDDMLKIGGSWVAPLEVEDALRSHPAVADCALKGVTVDGLTQGWAYVVAAPAAVKTPGAQAEAALAEALRSHVGRLLPPFKVPARVVLVHELPRTATGKLQRFRLGGDASASDPAPCAGETNGGTPTMPATPAR